METTLRPLTLGEILDRTAELYRTNFLLFAGISSIYAGILLVLSLVQIGAQQGALSLHMNTGLIVVSVIGLVVLWLAIFVAGGLAVAANTRAVGWVHLGEPASIGAAYRTILPRTGRYLWLMTITYFLRLVPLRTRLWCVCRTAPGLREAQRHIYSPRCSARPADDGRVSDLERRVSVPASRSAGVWHPHEPALLARRSRLHG